MSQVNFQNEYICVWKRDIVLLCYTSVLSIITLAESFLNEMFIDIAITIQIKFSMLAFWKTLIVERFNIYLIIIFLSFFTDPQTHDRPDARSKSIAS